MAALWAFDIPRVTNQAEGARPYSLGTALRSGYIEILHERRKNAGTRVTPLPHFVYIVVHRFRQKFTYCYSSSAPAHFNWGFHKTHKGRILLHNDGRHILNMLTLIVSPCWIQTPFRHMIWYRRNSCWHRTPSSIFSPSGPHFALDNHPEAAS